MQNTSIGFLCKNGNNGLSVIKQFIERIEISFVNTKFKVEKCLYIFYEKVVLREKQLISEENIKSTWLTRRLIRRRF